MLIFVIPLIAFFIGYNLISVRVVNERIEQTNKSTITLYQESIDNELYNIEKFMVDLTVNSTEYQQLRYKTSNLEAHLASYKVLNKYNTILNVHPMIGGMFIYSQKNQMFRKAYNEGFDLYFKDALENYIKTQTEKEATCNTKEWYVEQIEGQSVLLRILGNKGTYIVSAIRLNDIKSINSYNSNSEGFIIFSSVEGEPLTMVEKVNEAGISLTKNKETFYVTKGIKKYFVMKQKLQDKDLNMVYIEPSYGFMHYMDQAQIILIIASVLIILLIPVCYRMLQYSYFKPLDQLIKTMNRIKAGKLDSKMINNYKIKEFQQFSSTFNEMMEQIQYFKITAYEKEIESQRAKLQYLQKQIRPHFYLNCLKNIYGMAQQDKSKEIQEMILALSMYNRYTFRDSFEMVPFSLELDNVKNYVKLQQMTITTEIVCSIEVEDNLIHYGVPPISILTFVENSLKHGTQQNQSLKIHIKGKLLVSEDGEYVNITISDNGNGFSEEALRRLNSKEDTDNHSEHIGINNVKLRFSLIYNNKSAISFMNQAKGACVEIFIPYLLEHDHM